MTLSHCYTSRERVYCYHSSVIQIFWVMILRGWHVFSSFLSFNDFSCFRFAHFSINMNILMWNSHPWKERRGGNIKIVCCIKAKNHVHITLYSFHESLKKYLHIKSFLKKYNMSPGKVKMLMGRQWENFFMLCSSFAFYTFCCVFFVFFLLVLLDWRKNI